MNVEELVKQRFTQRQKVSSARYFLVKVEGVARGKTNPDAFKVTGTRVDTGDKVTVVSKKSASGQAIPEVGGIFRADKATQMKNENGVTSYAAEYFHAYGNNDLCVTATIQAQPPRQDESTGMWSASIRAIDTEVNTLHVPADKFNEKDLPDVLLPALKPWEATESSSITHDAKGDSIWKSPVKGLNPFVAIRFAGKVLNVYGIGAVDDGNGNVTFPSDSDIIRKINNNVPVQNMIGVLKDIPSEALSKITFTVMPGMVVNVGRESLAGKTQKYLAVPDAFRWVDPSKVDAEGKPATYAGWRENAQLHMKLTRTDRMVVVDAVPGSGGRLHRSIPDTAHEINVRLTKAKEEAAQHSQDAVPQQQYEQQPAPQESPAANQQSAQQPVQSASQQPQPAHQPMPQQEAATNTFDDEFEGEMGGMDDYADYANDLSAMESMNAPMTTQADEDFDDIMAQAEAKLLARRSAPSM